MARRKRATAAPCRSARWPATPAERIYEVQSVGLHDLVVQNQHTKDGGF